MGRQRIVVHAVGVSQGGELPDGVVAGTAGLVVSKAVGNSVVRHRVSRRLRHLLGARLPGLRVPAALVVRALPPAAGASSDELGRDLDAAFGRLSLFEVAGSTASWTGRGPCRDGARR